MRLLSPSGSLDKSIFMWKVFPSDCYFLFPRARIDAANNKKIRKSAKPANAMLRIMVLSGSVMQVETIREKADM